MSERTALHAIRSRLEDIKRLARRDERYYPELAIHMHALDALEQVEAAIAILDASEYRQQGIYGYTWVACRMVPDE